MKEVKTARVVFADDVVDVEVADNGGLEEAEVMELGDGGDKADEGEVDSDDDFGSHDIIQEEEGHGGDGDNKEDGGDGEAEEGQIVGRRGDSDEVDEDGGDSNVSDTNDIDWGVGNST